jgi:HD-like signal output (HDOD) protein
MKKILLVDDEINILKSLKRVFVDTEYEIYTANDGISALEILEQEEISLIISDMRMLGMDGYQLLEKVKEQYPKVFRLILSGYADEALVLNSLKKNIAKLYLYKPWDNEELLTTVNNVFETADLLGDESLIDLINNTGELPTIKENYRRILTMIQDNESIKRIGEEIEKDQAITSKIIHIVNSAYYGVKTGSVQQATSYLGLNCIEDLLKSMSVISLVEGGKTADVYLKKIWQHGYCTNQVLSIIYKKLLKKDLPMNASTAGLLHNIGVAFMCTNYGQDYYKLIEEANYCSNELMQLEEVAYDVDHCKLGGYLLQWWELPYSIVECALYHNRPEDKSIINKELVWAVHIAEVYTNGYLFKNNTFSFSSQSFDALGISYTQFMDVMEKIEL